MKSSEKPFYPRLFIWERHFYKEMIQNVLFLFCIFSLLFIVIDVMVHLRLLHKLSIFKWIEYYSCMLSRRLQILIPFSILIASIRVFLRIQSSHEITALRTAGVRLHRLLIPFLVVASIGSCIMLINYEWILPKAQLRLLFIREHYFGKEGLLPGKESVQIITLNDQSKITYKVYNPSLRELEDVFLVRSFDTILHIQKLSLRGPFPIGYHVTEIERTHGKNFETVSRRNLEIFNDLVLNPKILENNAPFQEQSLSQLAKKMLIYKNNNSESARAISASFFFKLLIPFLSILACIAPCSYCLVYRKHAPLFMIYLISIAGMFSFFLFIEASYTTAKNGLLPAWIAIGGPWLISFYIFGKKYATMHKK